MIWIGLFVTAMYGALMDGQHKYNSKKVSKSRFIIMKCSQWEKVMYIVITVTNNTIQSLQSLPESALGPSWLFMHLVHLVHLVTKPLRWNPGWHVVLRLYIFSVIEIYVM